MKKKLVMLLICCLLAGGAAGCKEVPVNETGGPATGSVGTETVSPGETEKLNGTKDETEDGTAEIPDRSDTGITEKKVAIRESESLFYIPSEVIEAGTGQEIYRFGDNLLVSYAKYDMAAKSSSHYLKVLSTETGELLYETVISGVTYTGVQVLEDQVAVCDHSRGDLWVLDETLQLVGEYQTPGGTVYLNLAGTKAYCFPVFGEPETVDLGTGATEQILAGHYDVTAGSPNGSCVVLTYVDGETLLSECAVLDLATGEITELSLDMTLVGAETDGTVWLADVYSGQAEYLLGKMEDGRGFRAVSGMGIPKLLGDSGRVMITATDGDGNLTLKLYDAEGKFVSSCAKNTVPGGLFYDPVWFAEYNGYFFTLTDSAGEERLYFWDLSVEVEGASLNLAELGQDEALPGTMKVSESLYERAKVLSEQYGVSVKIADECDVAVYPSYTADQTFDEAMIESALSTLEKVLAAYPEGFFGQLHYGVNREVEFHFVRNVDSKYSSRSIIGFMEEYRGTNVIGVNIDNASLASTLHHEISHVIEKKLAHDALYREGALFSEEKWASLNPEGFAYFGDVEVYPDYTWSYEYSLYFVDGYAGTDPNEDRARTFERAAIGHTPSFIGYPGLQKKLEYYCQCIRDAFDTTGWPEATVWEETLAAVKGR